MYSSNLPTFPHILQVCLFHYSYIFNKFDLLYWPFFSLNCLRLNYSFSAYEHSQCQYPFVKALYIVLQNRIYLNLPLNDSYNFSIHTYSFSRVPRMSNLYLDLDRKNKSHKSNILNIHIWLILLGWVHSNQKSIIVRTLTCDFLICFLLVQWHIRGAWNNPWVLWLIYIYIYTIISVMNLL